MQPQRLLVELDALLQADVARLEPLDRALERGDELVEGPLREVRIGQGGEIGVVGHARQLLGAVGARALDARVHAYPARR